MFSVESVWGQKVWPIPKPKISRISQICRLHCGDMGFPTQFKWYWKSISGWWFGTFFMFHNIWDNPSHSLSFFSEGLKPATSDIRVHSDDLTTTALLTMKVAAVCFKGRKAVQVELFFHSKMGENFVSVSHNCTPQGFCLVFRAAPKIDFWRGSTSGSKKTLPRFLDGKCWYSEIYYIYYMYINCAMMATCWGNLYSIVGSQKHWFQPWICH